LPTTETSLLNTPPLTPDEIKALQPGDRVVLIWAGGNGPHEYDVVIRGKGILASTSGGHLVGDIAYPLNQVWKIERK
jgi:hypothetical protein